MRQSAPSVSGAAPGSERSVDDVSRRRYVWGSAVGIVCSSAAFAWLVTGGTFDFFRSVPFSNFYDVQARSLLHGTWSMPASTLQIEGIQTHGRTDMYYGPVPALLRMPVLLVTHRFDGRLTEPSLFIAFLLGLVFVALLSWKIRGLVRGSAPVGRFEAGLNGAFLVVVGVGSVLFFLGSVAQVYEEAEMWGATLSLGAFVTLIDFLRRPSGRRLLATAVLITLALLTRASVGTGPVVAIGMTTVVYGVWWIAKRRRKGQQGAERLARMLGVRIADASGRFCVALAAAAAVPLVLYVTINEIKFDTPFTIPLNRQVISLESAHRRAVLAANGGSLFGWKFLPTSLLQFARPDALSIRRAFPWIFFPGKAMVVGNVLYDTRDWTSSVPAGMPVLTLLAVVGVVVVFRSRSNSGPAHARRRIRAVQVTRDPAECPIEVPAAVSVAVLRIPLVGAAAGTVGILTIAFIAERYLADAMPLIVLAGVVGWHVTLDHWTGRPGTARVVGAVLLALLALFEVWTSFSLSLFYQRELGPDITSQQRSSLVAFQLRVGRSLFGPLTVPVRSVSSLPARAEALDLAVVDRCAGVYQFDGNSWQPVELGAAGGARRFEVTFPRTDLHRRQPLLVTGGASPLDVVAVTWEGGDTYRFSYLFDGALFPPSDRVWFSEPPVTVQAGRPHQVQIDLDSRVQQVFITVDGAPAFELDDAVAPPTNVRTASAPASISTTPVFSGSIRSVPVSTPICDRLEQLTSGGKR